MNEAAGTYHDGRVSHARPVRISATDGLLSLHGEGIALSYPLSAIRYEPRLGDLPRRLDLPDGGSCVVAADFELPPSGAPAAPAERVDQWVTSLEGRWHVVFLAAVVVLGALWGAIVFGVPALARQVAMRMSPTLERQMGEQTLSALDRVALKPSTLDADRQQALTARFDRLVQLTSGDARYTLLFRASPAVGPNAFALPGGTVVLLDELVAIAANDDEIMAVLAHEIGHLYERHTMRLVLQTSVAGVLVAAVVGDVLSASSYAAALPAFLLQTRYSREFETEADTFGLHLLDRAGIDREHFIRLLTRLEKGHGDGLPGFLSTHPRTSERGRSDR
jgi:predicted Zn-dependent protease